MNTSHERSAHTRIAVRAQETRLLYLQAASSLTATLIVAIGVCIPLGNALPQASLLLWLGMMLAVSAARYGLVRRYWRMLPPAEEAPLWEKYFIAGAAVAGVAWGALGMMVVLRADISYQAFTAFALAGMAAGGTSSLSSRPTAYAAFLLPLLLPFAAALIVKGGTFHTSMGILTAAFAGLLIQMSLRIHRTISEALTLRFENDELLIEKAIVNERVERMNRVLEAEIVERKAMQTQLLKAKQEAEVANRAKSDFLANMSHEIRTPLTAIVGFAESIISGQQTPTVLVDAGQTILRNSHLLLEIINDILDMSKIEADKIEIERLSFSPLQVMQDVEKAVALQAGSKGLDLRIDYHFPIPENIVSDPTRFKQILLNLTSNAIKFTEKGSVKLEMRCEGEQLKIAISDSGIGISAKQISTLFSPFTQADSSTTRRYGGSGLGLYISRRLAQMLGGDITVSSQPGAGSRFEVSIATGPLEGVAQISSAQELQLPPVARETVTAPALKGHILLAEDGLDNQRLVTALIGRTGAEVTVVGDGGKAVEKTLSGDYALVLMDMQMPVMGGLDAIRILRGAGYMRPIYALTANVMKEDIERYQAAGCTGYLSKPIDRAKFYQTLAQHLEPEEKNRNQEKHDFFDSPEYRALIARFVSGLPSTMDKMKRAQTDRDFSELRGLAHTMKGTAASFGYPELSTLAAEIEHAIKSDHHEAIATGMARLDEAATRILANKPQP